MKTNTLHSLDALEESNRTLDEFNYQVEDQNGEYIAEGYYDRLTDAFETTFEGELLDEALDLLIKLQESVEIAQNDIRRQAERHLAEHRKTVWKESGPYKPKS